MHIPPLAVPEKLVDRAREYAAGVRTPVEPRDAATVLLLRPSADGPEVYLLSRQRSMSFAAGMCVFPGGGVDPRDSDIPDSAWSGPAPAEWAERLGVTGAEARALVAAAVRETFEECGVLLAGPAGDSDAVVDDVSSADWESDRQALESRELSLTSLLRRRDLVVRTDLLAPWSAWTTPEFEKKRYRTWFFAAELPAGQLTRDVSSESTEVLWLPASRAVEQAERAELAMMTPTYLNCLDAARFATPEEALSAGHGRTLEMFTPTVEDGPDGPAMSMPASLRHLVAARRGEVSETTR